MMAPFLESLLYLLVLLLIYPYAIFPIYVKVVHSWKRIKRGSFSKEPYFPYVSCIVAVYNEQDVIKEKIESILQSNYPSSKLKIYIGSDGSTDQSNLILTELKNAHEQVFINCFETRSGKTSVINKLTKWVLSEHPAGPDHILVYTDANIILQSDTISELMLPFRDHPIAIVDTRIIQITGNQNGVALTEKTYMNLESKIKRMEGEIWGLSMGAFGGCYALRSNYSCELPEGLLVDDFYISMQAMIKGGLSISHHNAICYEHIPDNLKEEFNRKRRIASGNFQNMQIFIPQIMAMSGQLAFVFLSHKVLRWLFPINLLLFFVTCLFLSILGIAFYSFLFVFSLLVWGGIPILDWLCQKAGYKIQWLRSWRYFVLMNIAVLLGFYRYLRGIRQSTWQPPKRIN